MIRRVRERVWFDPMQSQSVLRDAMGVVEDEMRSLANLKLHPCCALMWVVGSKNNGWSGWQRGWQRAPLTSQHTRHVTLYVGGDGEVGEDESQGALQPCAAPKYKLALAVDTVSAILILDSIMACIDASDIRKTTPHSASTIVGRGGLARHLYRVPATNNCVKKKNTIMK